MGQYFGLAFLSPLLFWIVAAAMNMARSGHEVWLWFEDAALTGSQPPLTGSTLVGGLLDVGEDLFPGWRFRQGVPDGEADLLDRVLRALDELNATSTSG